MRKILVLVLTVGLILALGTGVWEPMAAEAASEGEQGIKDMAGDYAMLMDNGTMWTSIYGEQMMRTPGDVVSISLTSQYAGLGVTRDGKLIEWDMGITPRVVEGQTEVKQVAGKAWLKEDGSVWTRTGKIKGLENIEHIAYGDRRLAALSSSGELFFEDSYKPNVFSKIGPVSDPSAVTAIAAYDMRVALLYNNGKVVLYQTFDFDDNGKPIPYTVTEDAVHIAFAESKSGRSLDALIVTRKDGTVWATGDYRDRIKLTEQYPGLSQIVKTSVISDSMISDMDHLYAQRSDGSWLLFEAGEVKPVEAPRVSALNVAVSEAKPFVGDKIKVDIQETYTNGADIKVKGDATNVTVDNPHLLRIESDGSLKVLGVGESKVTVTSGGLSQTITISASLRNNLKYAKVVGGVVYIPAKAVFQAMGGTVAPSGGGLDVKLGDTSLFFKANEKSAQLNGGNITLKAAPLTEKGETLIPASLLTEALEAQVKWDSEWQEANISFGLANMTIVSTKTASLIKKAMQGSLANYIGKSYWVNYFQGWDRFSKVTVTDILPDDTGSFIVVFKSASGKTLKSYSMTSSHVSDLFSDGSAFFNYDPYKKYKWSSAIWNQIKAGHINLGMTKEQVLLSWGEPAGKSTANANGKTVETWVYANFDTVVFMNGKVTIIIN
ncbi:stalk domain-containing protein [Paenibacillus sp. TH7-28]